MAGLSLIMSEVGRYGVMPLVGIELIFLLGVLTAWKFGLPLGDMKSPVLRIPLRLSKKPRKLWNFQRGIRRAYRLCKR
jgi:hypothetical protein